ncbi:thioredoxin-like protein [Lepidopterella palustris CBS 459.81]|uniref:Thioredoxin-like protein n=1 Tax=Lepidopterella palustris CBS 459.81 TaxID=1314670 RepID=A0A8E2EB77_9PEZI|nr:thioredoxin-like protein [Lepidopterella palustris CBS 459.81]
MSAAQDEFDNLFKDKGRESRHPEDAAAVSEEEESDPATDIYPEKDDEDDQPADTMRSQYYLPSIRSEANTGPKGVIADAHAFEQAKRARRLSFMRSKEAVPNSYKASAYHDEKSSEEEGEEGFMHRWRQSRLRELQKTGRRIRSRTSSPSKRVYGTLVTVDGDGYLDAIEKVRADTVVVVLIFDDMSDISSMVEDCVRKLAKQHSATRFVKLHYEDAEMEVAGVPAILAYKGGEKFAGLVPVMDEIPDDAELSPSTLEMALKRYQILF